MKKTTRRQFNTIIGKGVAGAALMTYAPFAARAEKNQDTKSLGIALVGLGSYSRGQLAPSLEETRHCHLAGIVTGTPAKAKEWKEKYSLADKDIYDYDNFDTIVNNKDIDIVYVVLPNSMHTAFCIRAAKAGKHVICEKPMAISVKECDDIIAACDREGVKLSVGYRLQSEPYTQELKRMVREKTFGEVTMVSADAAYRSMSNPGQWRLNRSLSGGGALMNMGVYAIQSAIYGSGQNPVSVSAQEFSTRPEYFKDTDETITAQFQFPNGAVGNIFTSHNVSANRHHTSCEKGWFELTPANNYGLLRGKRSDGTVIEFPHRRQQGLQMDDFAKHIMMDTPNVAPGEMGKRDMIIVEAIYQSIREGGKTIPLDLKRMGIVE
jgi:glucose-fructose oxidoreductase